MPFTPRKDWTADHDATPEETIASLARWQANRKQIATFYVCLDIEGRAGLYVADFPKGAYITTIGTPVGQLADLSLPLSLGSAMAEVERRGPGFAIIHWHSEPGCFRVAPYNAAVFFAISPPLSSWFTSAPVVEPQAAKVAK